MARTEADGSEPLNNMSKELGTDPFALVFRQHSQDENLARLRVTITEADEIRIMRTYPPLYPTASDVPRGDFGSNSERCKLLFGDRVFSGARAN